MTEQSNKPFPSLRDKHGVADLLREVSQRKSALTPKHRREVNEIVDRMGGNSSHTSNETPDQDLSDDSESSSFDVGDEPVGPVDKVNNFFQKFKQAPNSPQQDDEQRAPLEFFRKFSIQRMQGSTKQQEQDQAPSNGGYKSNERREEILKSLERSQQQGKDMLQKSQQQGKDMLQKSQQQGKEMLQKSQQQGKEILQKFSTNFQNFSSSVKTSLHIQTNADKAKEISETLAELNRASKHSMTLVKNSRFSNH